MISGDEHCPRHLEEGAVDFGDREDRVKDLEGLREIQARVSACLTKAYERNAKSYNLRRREVTFQKGEIALRKNYVLSDAAKHFSAKLAPKYVQCRVKQKLSPLAYRLVDMRGKDVGTWHDKDLKPHPPESGDEDEDEPADDEGTPCNTTRDRKSVV